MNYLGRSSQFMLIEVFHLKLQKEIFETESDRRFFWDSLSDRRFSLELDFWCAACLGGNCESRKNRNFLQIYEGANNL